MAHEFTRSRKASGRAARRIVCQVQRPAEELTVVVRSLLVEETTMSAGAMCLTEAYRVLLLIAESLWMVASVYGRVTNVDAAPAASATARVTKRTGTILSPLIRGRRGGVNCLAFRRTIARSTVSHGPVSPLL